MSQVIIWDDGISFDNDDILIFLDEDYYNIYIDDEFVATPSFRYILSPNYSDEMLPILMYYIFLKHSDICSRDKFLEANPQFKIWENLIIGLNSFDINLFSENYILAQNTPIYSQYNDIFKCIKHYFSGIIEPFSNSLYYNTSSSDKKKNWLLNKLNTKNYFDNYIKNIDQDETIPFIIQSKVFVEEKIKIINKLDLNENKFFYMSCYCYQLALYYFKLNQYQISFTLLQRTLDFYFQSRAFEDSLIIATSYGMKFNYTVEFDNKPVGIYFLEKCLRNYGNINYDKERSEFLNWLNDMRNTLMITHGVFNVEKVNVEDTITKTLKTIEQIEGSKRWEILSNKFSLTSDFSHMVLFDLEPSIELYFRLQ